MGSLPVCCARALLTEEAIALAAEVDLDFALQVECNLEIRNGTKKVEAQHLFTKR